MKICNATNLKFVLTSNFTDKKEIGDGLVNTQEKNQDILIDGLVADQFSDLSSTEQKNVKEVLRALLNGRDGKEIMNFIHSDPKLFYSVVFSAYKEKTKQKLYLYKPL